MFPGVPVGVWPDTSVAVICPWLQTARALGVPGAMSPSTVKTRDAPAASAPIVYVSVDPLCDDGAGVEVRLISSGGSVSASDTDDAGCVPLLRTVIVYATR